MPPCLLVVSLLAAGNAPLLKLAMPGFAAVNVDEKTADLYADYFAQRLTESGGIRVTTKSEVGSLVGFERQRRLLGCSDQSCLAELAGALGVEGILVGNLGNGCIPRARCTDTFQCISDVVQGIGPDQGTLALVSRAGWPLSASPPCAVMNSGAPDNATVPLDYYRVRRGMPPSIGAAEKYCGCN